MTEVEVIEEWRIVDRWWTDEPVESEWRNITRPDGTVETQRRYVRNGEPDEWETVDRG